MSWRRVLYGAKNWEMVAHQVEQAASVASKYIPKPDKKLKGIDRQASGFKQGPKDGLDLNGQAKAFKVVDKVIKIGDDLDFYMNLAAQTARLKAELHLVRGEMIPQDLIADLGYFQTYFDSYRNGINGDAFLGAIALRERHAVGIGYWNGVDNWGGLERKSVARETGGMNQVGSKLSSLEELLRGKRSGRELSLWASFKPEMRQALNKAINLHKAKLAASRKKVLDAGRSRKVKLQVDEGRRTDEMITDIALLSEEQLRGKMRNKMIRAELAHFENMMSILNQR